MAGLRRECGGAQTSPDPHRAPDRPPLSGAASGAGRRARRPSGVEQGGVGGAAGRRGELAVVAGGQLGAAAQGQLLEDVGEVRLHGRLGDAEPVGGLEVAQPFDDQLHDLLLATAEPLMEGQLPGRGGAARAASSAMVWAITRLVAHTSPRWTTRMALTRLSTVALLGRMPRTPAFKASTAHRSSPSAPGRMTQGRTPFRRSSRQVSRAPATWASTRKMWAALRRSASRIGRVLISVTTNDRSVPRS